VLVGMAVLVNLNPLAIRLERGELETLASSVLFTAQILCVESPRYASNRPQSFTTIMLLAMGLFAVPIVLLTAPDVSTCIRICHSPPFWGLQSVLVLVCSISPFLLMNRWQREVTATEAGLVYCAEPVVVSLLALFLPGLLSHWAGVDYPNEQMSVRLALGGGLITAANVLLQVGWLEPKPAET
jgi:drug/metabolite transporter (DMT)-like permease